MISDEKTVALGQREHNEDAASKRVVVRAQDPSSGDWVNIAAVDNGDGTFSLGTSPRSSSTLTDGRTIVTTAGTRVPLASSTPCKWVLITAETDNTNVVVVGSASTVVAAIATRQGIPLFAGDAVTLEVNNLADVGLDSAVSGDGVTYVYGS